MRGRFLLVALMLTALVSSAASGEVRVFFSPHGGCDQALLQLIRTAETEVDAACYTFTLDSIADELIAAEGRGVRVRVILDRSQAAQRRSRGERLLAAGIPVKVNAHSGLMHHKFLVADGKSVATGSFNWTKSAVERNDENLVVFLDEPAMARAFGAEFGSMWAATAQPAALSPLATETQRTRRNPTALAILCALCVFAVRYQLKARRRKTWMATPLPPSA